MFKVKIYNSNFLIYFSRWCTSDIAQDIQKTLISYSHDWTAVGFFLNMTPFLIFPKQIEPSIYPKLFQKSLDPDLFNQILRILHDFYIE